MIPAGTYRAHAIDAALGVAGTGKEQIAVLFETVAAGEESPHRITWYGYFTEATFDRTIESLRHLGWKGNDLSIFGLGVPEDCHNEVEIVIDHQPDPNGNIRARVQWINSGGGLAMKSRMDEGQARAFAAKMKARIASLGPTNGSSTAAAPSKTNGGGAKPAAGRKPAAAADRPRGASKPTAGQVYKGDEPSQDLGDAGRPANFEPDPQPRPADITDDDIPF